MFFYFTTHHHLYFSVHYINISYHFKINNLLERIILYFNHLHIILFVCPNNLLLFFFISHSNFNNKKANI